MKKEMAKEYIDMAAGEARGRYISMGLGQESTYMMKATQAREYVAAGYTGTVPPLINAEVLATGASAQQVADTVIATESQWMVVASEIERLRRSGKIGVDALTDALDIADHCDAVIASLEAI